MRHLKVEIVEGEEEPDSLGELEKKWIQLIVFDPQKEEILQWITEF